MSQMKHSILCCRLYKNTLGVFSFAKRETSLFLPEAPRAKLSYLDGATLRTFPALSTTNLFVSHLGRRKGGVLLCEMLY